MGNWFSDAWDSAWNPFNGNLFTKGITGTLSNAWNDFTGITASNLSAEAANRNTQTQLAWERERALNAHQWEVEDLTKAGLNPILSAGGSGAVTGGISPQMPDYSQYKGWGAVIPLIGDFFDNILKNANSANAMADARLKTDQLEINTIEKNLKMYQMGLINAETAGKQIENEIEEINKNWLPYEKGVGIAKDVAQTVLPFAVGGMAIRGIGNTATQVATKMGKIQKTLNKIKNPWKKVKGGGRVNTITGEYKEALPHKNIKLNIKIYINKKIIKY